MDSRIIEGKKYLLTSIDGKRAATYEEDTEYIMLGEDLKSGTPIIFEDCPSVGSSPDFEKNPYVDPNLKKAYYIKMTDSTDDNFNYLHADYHCNFFLGPRTTALPFSVDISFYGTGEVTINIYNDSSPLSFIEERMDPYDIFEKVINSSEGIKWLNANQQIQEYDEETIEVGEVLKTSIEIIRPKYYLKLIEA